MSDINFNNFVSRIPDINILRKYTSDDFKLIDFSFWIVKHEIPNALKKNNYEKAISFIKDVSKLNNYQKTKVLLHLINELEKIATLEKNHLQVEPDLQMQKAGVKELNKLGVEGVVWSLAQDDPTKFEQTKNMPYKYIFSLQLKKVIWSRIMKRIKEK